MQVTQPAQPHQRLPYIVILPMPLIKEFDISQLTGFGSICGQKHGRLSIATGRLHAQAAR